jgi:hypothetical protein
VGHAKAALIRRRRTMAGQERTQSRRWRDGGEGIEVKEPLFSIVLDLRKRCRGCRLATAVQRGSG